MDPKSSPQLDPKLQEVYNRVMGVDLNTPGSSPQPAAQTTPSTEPTFATPASLNTPPQSVDPTAPTTIQTPPVTLSQPISSAQAPTSPVTVGIANPPTDTIQPSASSSLSIATPTSLSQPGTPPVDPMANVPLPTPAFSEQVVSSPAPELVSSAAPTPVVESPTPLPTTPPVVSNMHTDDSKPHAFVAKSGRKTSPVILAVGAIAFLMVYTVIWIKVFNLSVPFINQ